MKNGRSNKSLIYIIVCAVLINLLFPMSGVLALEEKAAGEREAVEAANAAGVISVREAIENNSGRATVEGYIVGTRASNTSSTFQAPFVATNIQLADHPNERGLSNLLPVQLPSGTIRTALNLVDNPENLGKKIRITGNLENYFSHPGLRSPTAFEFVEESENPDPTNPVISILEARGKVGQVVVTEGIVNVDNGLLQPGRLSVYLQDGEAGIQLFNHNAGNFPVLNAGDKVKVKGRVGEFNRVTQILVEEVEKIESGLMVAAKEVSIADYQNPQVAESYEGQLVQLEGYVYSVPSYSGGGANITVIDENLNVLIIRAWESTGINLSQIEANKWYQITAISSQFNTTYQLLPRSNQDIRLAEVQKEKPISKGKEIRATVERVVDGDTIRLASPVFGANNVRFLNIDTLETYHTVRNELDQIQMDLGKLAGAHLGTMLAAGDEVILRIGEEPLDSYGRLLAEVITLDGVNTNLEMVRSGHAVTYFIWPFEDEAVEVYSAALRNARLNNLGIWNVPNWEFPFEFRARERGSELVRPVGDYRTKRYVEPNQWQSILPEYRVFFNTEENAVQAGYAPFEENSGDIIDSMLERVDSLYEDKEIYKKSTYTVIKNRIAHVKKCAQKVEEKKDSRSLKAHEKNLQKAIDKLESDIEREYSKGNMSQHAVEVLRAHLDLIKGQNQPQALDIAS
ncbi:DUF6359 domain-containing protein [Caldalkalibacillus mannanilyticus]|uniref:DUF6359 domain-containing protein n=1 Tax=Caldalkalibacillus mannanilyticus TaxID=1418 RepID=UPI000469846A|nr:DUF6359 domain-containing protein [Caldalkalibacillus mannanilyticus]